MPRPICHCLDPQYEPEHWGNFESDGDEQEVERRPWRELLLHAEEQDVDCAPWRRLNDLIEQAAADGREEFAPARELPASDWAQITVLPKSIAKLKKVRRLYLYGSSLVRIPPEIGEMTAPESFIPYTSRM